MKKQELQKIIQDIAEEAIPSNRNVWPSLQEKLATQQRPRTRNWFLPTSRLGRLAFALSIVLLISITAYASEPWINRLIGSDNRLKHVDLSLRYPLNLSKTIDDVTITLDWAYADKDWVLIGYNLRSSDASRYEPTERMLTEQEGVIFPWQGSYGFISQCDFREEASLSGEYSYVGIFENISDSITIMAHFEVKADSLPETYSEESPSETNNNGKTVILTPMHPGRTIGPFVFDFVIPEVLSADISQGN